MKQTPITKKQLTAWSKAFTASGERKLASMALSRTDLSTVAYVPQAAFAMRQKFSVEIPTLDVLRWSIPISGGGYMRLFPFWMLRILLGMYARRHENFTIYVHPFELTDLPLPLPEGLGASTRFRCLVGRGRNLRKLRRVIRWLKKRGARFVTLEGDRRERGLA